jgi:hypothetical protein
VFSSDDREQLRTRLIERARSDPRISAAAAVGSSASGGDRWSDLDLTFAVAPGVPVKDVLDEWTGSLVSADGAAVLFDLPVWSTIYRVFLLPGALQVDLSFTPASDFGARGPRFELLFGDAVRHPDPGAPPLESLFGLGVHHAVRGHICIERGRVWQAEYWIHETRNQALALACQRRGLESSHGRGFDALPADVRDAFAGSLARDLTAPELRRALAVATAGLLREAADIPESVRRVEPMLAEILDAHRP